MFGLPNVDIELDHQNYNRSTIEKFTDEIFKNIIIYLYLLLVDYIVSTFTSL